MTLKSCEKFKPCRVLSLNLTDLKIKRRLYQIGFFSGSVIQVLNTSSLKKTLLVQVLDSCFAIKSSIAENIEVEYV